ncbi:hypothetical protein D5086_024859 [Populus alba]|uniref:Uncharacterized protein n=1 Tax=Populus alba TaxID=43335 RepID=A0ACC4B7C0_POPAL
MLTAPSPVIPIHPKQWLRRKLSFLLFSLQFSCYAKNIKIMWLHSLSAALSILSLENVSLGSTIRAQMENAGNIAWKIARKTKEVSAN